MAEAIISPAFAAALRKHDERLKRNDPAAWLMGRPAQWAFEMLAYSRSKKEA